MARSRSSGAKNVQIRARVKVWLEADGHYAFGFGLSEILKAVESAGSIKEAAHRLGKSYRYVWGRVKKAESTLGQSLVEARVGGAGTCRSEITPMARKLVSEYDALRRRMFDVAEDEFRQQFSRRAVIQGIARE